MKWIPIILAALMTITSCNGNEGISFCEGVDTEGGGVNCGKKFSTGDLTAVITSESNFVADRITVKVADITSGKENPVKAIILNVKGEEKRTNTNLPFYNAGRYKVEAYRDTSLISSGTIEIAED